MFKHVENGPDQSNVQTYLVEIKHYKLVSMQLLYLKTISQVSKLTIKVMSKYELRYELKMHICKNDK